MSLDTIVNVIGGKTNIGRDIHSPLDFIKASREGQVTTGVIRAIQGTIRLTNKRMSSILEISDCTLQRHLKGGGTLNKSESETAYDVSKVIAKGMEVFENEDDFNEWLNTKSTALGNERPIDLLDSYIGREQLIHVLNALEHSIYS